MNFSRRRFRRQLNAAHIPLNQVQSRSQQERVFPSPMSFARVSAGSMRFRSFQNSTAGVLHFFLYKKNNSRMEVLQMLLMRHLKTGWRGCELG